LILEGRVSVNNEVIRELATDVKPGEDHIEVGGEIIELPAYRYYLLNKPAGYTCTREDSHAEKTVFELLPNDPSLFTVGRLDRETTGLLLVTNDGDFAQNIIHPSKKIKKKYQLELKDTFDNNQLLKLQGPVELEDGPAKVFSARQIGNGKIELEIEEGRKRIVRRIVKAIGNEVVALERTKIGEYLLDVPVGEYRELTSDEVNIYV
jgi:23S rRNA pseudouridine2605 synthase